MKGLEVPCTEYIVIMVIAHHLLISDGSAVRASCYEPNGFTSGYDFFI